MTGRSRDVMDRPDGEVGRLLDYVAATSGVVVGGAAAGIRLSAADAALELANTGGAPADKVAACVKAVEEASVTYYGDRGPASAAFADVRRDMIDRARARDSNRGPDLELELLAATSATNLAPCVLV
jgi:hypothetical protein